MGLGGGEGGRLRGGGGGEEGGSDLRGLPPLPRSLPYSISVCQRFSLCPGLLYSHPSLVPYCGGHYGEVAYVRRGVASRERLTHSEGPGGGGRGATPREAGGVGAFLHTHTCTRGEEGDRQEACDTRFPLVFSR